VRAKDRGDERRNAAAPHFRHGFDDFVVFHFELRQVNRSEQWTRVNGLT
jgi:hypothetical protein